MCLNLSAQQTLATARAKDRAKNSTKVANDGDEPLGADGGCGAAPRGMGWFIADANEQKDVVRVLFEPTGDTGVQVTTE